MKKTLIFMLCTTVLALATIASLSMLEAQACQIYSYSAETDISLYGYLNQHDVPDFGEVACGPTAAVNSFVYLQNKYPNIYDHYLIGGPSYANMIAAADCLGRDFMNTPDNNGTKHEDFILGKREWIEISVPKKTIYLAQDLRPWTVSKPDFVEITAPTYIFLYEQLKAKEDVEILLSRSNNDHYVTLTSFKWDDLDCDDKIHRYEDATIDFIDPMTGQKEETIIWHALYQGSEVIATEYDGYDYIISMAVSESPVIPEPSTTILMGFSLLGFVWVRFREKS